MLASILLSVVVSAVPAAKSTSWIPLVKVGPAFDATWKSSLVAASELQLNTKKRTKMVQPPETSIDNTMVAMGCVKWEPKCAHRIGEALGAQRKLMVNVAAKDDGATIGFILIDRKGKVVRSAGPYQLPDRAKEGRGRALKAVRAFIYGRTPTELVVKVAPSNATVRINKRKQRKRKAVVTVTGKYAVDAPLTVVVSAKGFETQTQMVKLEAGVTTTLDVKLQKPAPVVAIAPKDETPPPDDVVVNDTPSEPDVAPDGPSNTNDPSNDVATADVPPDEVASADPPDETTQEPAGSGVTQDEPTGGGDIGPILGWTGIGAMSVAAVSSAVAVAPWAYSVFYAFAEPDCETSIQFDRIEARCPTAVKESAAARFGEDSHLFPWVGVPVAGLIGAAGIGLLVSGIVLGGSEPLEEGSEPPPAPTSASLGLKPAKSAAHPLAPLP